MKIYIKPNTTMTTIVLDKHLLTISGGEQQKQGSSNGEYSEGVTLGSRRSTVWGDDEDE